MTRRTRRTTSTAFVFSKFAHRTRITCRTDTTTQGHCKPDRTRRARSLSAAPNKIPRGTFFAQSLGTRGLKQSWQALNTRLLSDFVLKLTLNAGRTRCLTSIYLKLALGAINTTGQSTRWGNSSFITKLTTGASIITCKLSSDTRRTRGLTRICLCEG